MFLIGSKYTEPEAAIPEGISDQKLEEIRARIRALVPQDSDRRMSRRDVVKALENYYLSQNQHIHDSVYKQCFQDVFDEYIVEDTAGE